MKLIMFLLLFPCYSYSQISVGPNPIGPPKIFKKGELKTFKSTKTVFVLSNIYEKKVYEEILKAHWNVTPYILVDFKDFEIESYLSDEYSIAKIMVDRTSHSMGAANTGSRYIKLNMFIDFRIYDNKTIFKKLNKLSKRRRIKLKNYILEDNSTHIARFLLSPKNEFLEDAINQDLETRTSVAFSEDVFYNYNLGYLKNYLQIINDLIKEEKLHWLYGNDNLSEVKKLKKHTLYVPSYVGVEFNAMRKNRVSKNPEKNINDLFKKYEYDYEIIDNEDLSNRIMNNEAIYYLRIAKGNGELFLQVVNAQSGTEIYRSYYKGFSYNLKGKHIAKLNNSISQK